MTFLELKNKLDELPPEVLNRPAIAVCKDEDSSVYYDYKVEDVSVGKICRRTTYMEFAEIKLGRLTMEDYHESDNKGNK
jgi:hypothetical protein